VGLYSLGNGWMLEGDGEFRVVAAAGSRAHAATATALRERGADGWHEVALPASGAVVDVAYGTVPYAVTADGVVFAEREGGWRATSLGVGGVVGCAVGEGTVGGVRGRGWTASEAESPERPEGARRVSFTFLRASEASERGKTVQPKVGLPVRESPST
jgi:hypothetical protein